MTYIFVGMGGVLGAVLRYALGKWIARHRTGSFPAGTFIINLTGALALGIVTVLLARLFPADVDLKAFLTTGLLGSYTTFSTFSYETVQLIEEREYFQAAGYILGSVFLGIALCFGAVSLI